MQLHMYSLPVHQCMWNKKRNLDKLAPSFVIKGDGDW